MPFNLLSEFQGYNRFLSRASNEIIAWFGNYCDNNVSKIVFLASKEWDGMADLERKPFIRSYTCLNGFVNYLMNQHYESLNCEGTLRVDVTSESGRFRPEQVKRHAQTWKTMSAGEQSRFLDLDTSIRAMDHVIEKRSKLHQLYGPRDLNILEYILRTRPKQPVSSRIWFLRVESDKIKSSESMKAWHNLSFEQKSLYARCAVLDSRRYNLEKNAWIARIVDTNLTDDNFTISDFELSEMKSKIESLGSIVELSKDLPTLIGLKRPREPFSLFIEAYQYQIREERPDFKFGPHLKACSEAWSKLSDEEKQFYKDESKKLKEKRKDLLRGESMASGSLLSIPVELFKPDKELYGPCRVSHLFPRLPTIHQFWASRNRTDVKLAKSAWESLDERTKKEVKRDYERLKDLLELRRKEIDEKHKEIKRLIREAKKLEQLKRELGLIGRSGKPVKNVYPAR